MTRLHLAPLLLGLMSVAACTVLNAPDDVVPQATGGGGGAGGGTTTTSSAGGGGMGGAAAGGGGAGGGAPAVCGDGALSAGEECDDGNLDAGDACSPLCKPVVFDIAADAVISNDGPGVGTSGAGDGKGFAVVWREDNAGVHALHWAIYAANGARLQAPAALHGPGGPIDRPRMGTSSTNRSIVAFRTVADDTIRIHGLNPDGSALAAGEQAISSSQSVALSQVATKGGGELCLVWIAPGVAPNVKARCVDPQGSIQFTVTQTIGGSDAAGAPGLWSAGNLFVAAWNDATSGALHGRLLDTAGVAQGSAFTIPSNGNQNLSPAGVATAGNGHVAIFEQVFDQGPISFTRLTKREFQSPDTSSVLDSFISSSADHDEEGPAVAAANGKYVVAWTDNNVNFGDIVAQVFDEAGAKVGDPIQVNKTAPGGTQRLARAAVNPDGDVMFVWESVQAGLSKVSAMIIPRLLAP